MSNSEVVARLQDISKWWSNTGHHFDSDKVTQLRICVELEELAKEIREGLPYLMVPVKSE